MLGSSYVLHVFIFIYYVNRTNITRKIMQKNQKEKNAKKTYKKNTLHIVHIPRIVRNPDVQRCCMLTSLSNTTKAVYNKSLR